MEAYPRTLTTGVLVEDTSRGRVRALWGGQTVVTYRLNDRDAASIVEGVQLLGELLFAAGATRLILPFDGAPPVSSERQLRALLDRSVARSSMNLFTVHVMGTAAMGGDRTRHVCDPHGRVYDAEGLYVGLLH
jgi:choline dehydrogenase-like flavoprotein